MIWWWIFCFFSRFVLPKASITLDFESFISIDCAFLCDDYYCLCRRYFISRSQSHAARFMTFRAKVSSASWYIFITSTDIASARAFTNTISFHTKYSLSPLPLPHFMLLVDISIDDGLPYHAENNVQASHCLLWCTSIYHYAAPDTLFFAISISSPPHFDVSI